MRFALPIAALALVVLSGCVNPFKPADPERPTGGVSVLENFIEPESVLVTMERAVAAQSDGSTAYENALAPGFLATHAPEVVDQARTAGVDVPAEWNLTRERNNLFQYLVGLRTDQYELTFFRDNSLPADELASGQVLLHRKYTVFTRRVDGTIQDTLALGIAELTLQLDNSRWAVSLWKDTYLPEIGVNPVDTDLQSMGARRLNSLAAIR